MSWDAIHSVRHQFEKALGGTNPGYLQSMSFPQELYINGYNFPGPVSTDIS